MNQIQKEQKEWTEKNFGDQEEWVTVMGVQEEVGELAHHILKRHQGIRQSEDHEEGVEDAIGDIFIYLLGVCNKQELLFSAVLEKVWDNIVSKRDWTPETGVVTEGDEHVPTLHHYGRSHPICKDIGDLWEGEVDIDLHELSCGGCQDLVYGVVLTSLYKLGVNRIHRADVSMEQAAEKARDIMSGASPLPERDWRTMGD